MHGGIEEMKILLGGPTRGKWCTVYLPSLFWYWFLHCTANASHEKWPAPNSPSRPIGTEVPQSSLRKKKQNINFHQKVFQRYREIKIKQSMNWLTLTKSWKSVLYSEEMLTICLKLKWLWNFEKYVWKILVKLYKVTCMTQRLWRSLACLDRRIAPPHSYMLQAPLAHTILYNICVVCFLSSYFKIRILHLRHFGSLHVKKRLYDIEYIQIVGFKLYI